MHIHVKLQGLQQPLDNHRSGNGNQWIIISFMSRMDNSEAHAIMFFRETKPITHSDKQLINSFPTLPVPLFLDISSFPGITFQNKLPIYKPLV